MVKRGERLYSHTLTSLEKIVIHLRESPPYRKEMGAPFSLTQQGIADSVGMRLNHVSRAVKKLKETGYVSEMTARVRGEIRKRKIYLCTQEGFSLAEQIKDEISKRKILVKEGQSKTREMPFSELRDNLGFSVSTLDIITNIDGSGTLDLGVMTSPRERRKERKVVFSDGLPLADLFYNRTDEKSYIEEWLESTSRKALAIAGPRGIGKTSLALEIFTAQEGKRNVFWYSFRKWDSTESLLSAISSFLSQMGKTRLAVEFSKDDHRLKRLQPIMEDLLQDTEAVYFFDDVSEISGQLQEFFVDFLGILVRTPGNKALLMAESGYASFQEQLIARNMIERIRLRGLNRESCRKLLQKKMEDAEFEQIYKLTEGHPLSFKLIASRGLEDFAKADDYSPEEIAVLKYMKLFDRD